MGKYFDMLMEDVRMKEGLTACINCGICTGVCPAAEFYDYDPRQIVNTVQTKDDDAIEQLLKSETIWYCGECMSCRPRCPRANTPGYIIQALRRLSQKLGFFTYSEKGRQQLAIKRTIGHNILKTGYCIKPNLVDPELHPEQGPVWKWIYEHDRDVFERFAEDAPGLKETIQLLNEQFTDELMSELTYRVDVAGEEVETVAHDFLVQSGLLDA